MIDGFKNILVLAPHTDDGELGCGGTIVKLIESGANVFYAAFSAAEQSLPPTFHKNTLKIEVKNATRVLGIKEENLFIFNYEVRKLNYARQEILETLINLRKEITFDLVFLPSPHDVHQDHQTVTAEGLRAFKTISIFGYELVWNNLTFDTTSFVKLEKSHIERKVLALQEYKSQVGRKYMCHQFIHSLATVRGTQIGSDYAEAFEVIRLVMQ